jgi:hypothetical protein
LERRKGQARVVVAARRRDGSWQHSGRDPLALSGWREEIGEFDVGLGQRGTVVVTWSERDASRWRIVVRRTGPAPDGWRDAEPMAESTEAIARVPHVAVGGVDERAILAWRMDDELWYRFLE